MDRFHNPPTSAAAADSALGPAEPEAALSGS
jgi:hypothetical protein